MDKRCDDRPDAMPRAERRPRPIFAPRNPSATLLVRVSLFLGLTLLAGMAAHPSSVNAASRTELRKAEALATEAKAYFKGKLYQQAADKFMESFAIAGRPALVFNAARAYEEARLPKRAIAIFEMYTTLGDVSAEGKADARARVKKLKAEVALRDKAAREKEQLKQRARDQEARKRDDERRRREARARRAQKPPTPVRPARGPFPVWRTTGGGTLIAMGLISLGLSHSVANEIPSKDVTNRELMTEYLDNASSARTWYGMFIGATAIGAGLIAWGQYDYWLPPAAGKGEGKIFSAVQLAPVAYRGGAGFELRLRF